LRIENREWRIIYFEKIDSTQKYLLENLDKFNLPICIWSEFQTAGVGTRNRKWIGEKGNLFFSFAISLEEFDFIPRQSLSVYFSYILYEILKSFKKNLIIKWPNDIYLLEDRPKKVAGILINIRKNIIICGIGVNTQINPNVKIENYESGCLCVKGKNDKILKEFLFEISKKPKWKNIFKEYKKIFEISKNIFDLKANLNNDATIKG